MALVQLIYVSSLVSLDMESELGKILESSVRHNLENGITGMLLYSGGNFIQVLEGDQDKVGETYERILADPRHISLT